MLVLAAVENQVCNMAEAIAFAAARASEAARVSSWLEQVSR